MCAIKLKPIKYVNTIKDNRCCPHHMPKRSMATHAHTHKYNNVIHNTNSKPVLITNNQAVKFFITWYSCFFFWYFLQISVY